MDTQSDILLDARNNVHPSHCKQNTKLMRIVFVSYYSGIQPGVREDIFPFLK
jgi:hypothetical protein